MQLKLTTDYAIRVLLYLSQRERGWVATGNEISKNVGIGQQYVQKVAGILRRAGFISSVQGSNGGFRLALSPEKISLLDVILASETTLKINRCLKKQGACNLGLEAVCPVHQRLDVLQVTMEEYLRKITFADLI